MNRTCPAPHWFAVRSLIPLLLAGTTGCLFFEEHTVTVRFVEDGLVEYEETYLGLGCDASANDTTKARDEFEDLVENSWLGDAPGVEAAEKGWYLKERRLWIKDGRLEAMRRLVGSKGTWPEEDGSDGWTEDSTGYYYADSTSTGPVTTNGTQVRPGLWHWPPDVGVITVRFEASAEDRSKTRWRREFAEWYRAYAGEHGLDEYGRKSVPATPSPSGR